MFVSIVLAAAVSAPVAGYRITGYARDQMHVYDASGAMVGAVAASSLPHTPVAIVGENHQHLGISVDGKIVYLRNAEVITADVPPSCTATATASRKGTSVVAATPGGVNAGLGERSLPCTDDKILK